MWIIGLLVTMLLQAPPAQTPPVDQVIVGLIDGRQLAVANPSFEGFIYGRGGEAYLLFRQRDLHSRLLTASIARIDFRAYREGKPFALTVTLKTGEKLEVESERRNYVMVSGQTSIGAVTIKHPDPLSSPVRLSTHSTDRKKDLTIQYLEFPAS